MMTGTLGTVHPYGVAETPRRYGAVGAAVPVAHRVDPQTVRPADRIYHVDTDARWQEGTVTRVYLVGKVLHCDIVWDSSNDQPLVSRIQQRVALSVLDTLAWGIILHRIAPDQWSRARRCLFPLGQLVATPGALDVLNTTGASVLGYLLRHQTGDWGELSVDDCRANAEGLVQGTRIFSAYALPTGHRIWIITEADRSLTTVLLPSEY